MKRFVFTLGFLAVLVGAWMYYKYVMPADAALKVESSIRAMLPGSASKCPAGMPTADFHATNAGSRDWFNTLPKETPQGTTFCADTAAYRDFLLASGTLNGQKMSGWDVLALHYSFASIGNDSRKEELKRALVNVGYPSVNGAENKDVVLVKLPGYKVAESVTPVQLCTESTCFKPETQKSLGQTARTQTATPTITPWPTAILKLEYIPTDIPSTPLPNVPPSAPQWLQEHGYFRVFESYHCQSVQPIYVNTFAASNVWSSTGQVTLLHGDFGWYAFGNRVDVPFLVDQGQYNIYSFCAQIIGMPDWTNIDGKGTNCQFCAVARKDPPPGVLDVNGVINKGGTYWVKLYDVWYGPASRNAQQPVPTTTPWPTPTPKPPEQFLTVDAAIRLNSNSFITWEAVNPKDLPTRANPKIWMNSYAGTYLIDFSKYLDKLGSGHAFWLDNCGTPVMKTYKGFQITRNDQLNVNWCILPGK